MLIPLLVCLFGRVALFEMDVIESPVPYLKTFYVS